MAETNIRKMIDAHLVELTARGMTQTVITMRPDDYRALSLEFGDPNLGCYQHPTIGESLEIDVSSLVPTGTVYFTQGPMPNIHTGKIN